MQENYMFYSFIHIESIIVEYSTARNAVLTNHSSLSQIFNNFFVKISQKHFIRHPITSVSTRTWPLKAFNEVFNVAVNLFFYHIGSKKWPSRLNAKPLFAYLLLRFRNQFKIH